MNSTFASSLRRPSRILLMMALATALVFSFVPASAQAETEYLFDSDSWSYSYYGGYTSFSGRHVTDRGFWTITRKATDVRLYSKAYGSSRTRLDSRVSFGKTTGSFSTGGHASFSVVSTGCKYQGMVRSSYYAATSFGGTVCKVTSATSAWFRYASTTATHRFNGMDVVHTAVAY